MPVRPGVNAIRLPSFIADGDCKNYGVLTRQVLRLD
jgi:hypothetical protein